MSKEELTAAINEVDKILIDLSSHFDGCKTEFISKKQTQQRIQLAAKKWFEEIDPAIHQFGVSQSTQTKYCDLFTQLLHLSLRPQRKTTCQKAIEDILVNFKDDVLVAVIKSAGKITSIANLTRILENVTLDEKEYLNEALGCARYGFHRASMVLVWSATINRMQKTIGRLGLEEFNRKSEEMKKISEGRFKRFNKSYNVHSLSELRATVFDTDLLWILEYWGLIDSNQHDRLGTCFTMRNNAAHPGDAVITDLNLASAFSDVKTIVFDNPKFKLET